MLLKYIPYLELWQPICWLEQNNWCILGRWHHEEHFCEIIFNLDQWVRRRCCLKIFLIWSSGGPLANWNGTICAILVKGIMRNYCEIILNLDLTVVQEKMS